MSTGRRSVIEPISGALAGVQQLGNKDQTMAAFKMLPIDPTRVRRTSEGGEYVESPNDYITNGATTCREAVDLVVKTIARACADMGIEQSGFVREEDVVRSAI